MAKRKRECAYCGSRKETTRDHIPPKNLFSGPLPSNLITVPCCRTCNKLASKDDEYFRMMLVMRDDAGDHPEAQKVFRSSVLKSLQRPEARGLTKRLQDNLFDLDLYTKAGIYVTRRGGYWVDHKRLDRVAARIVRGLYCHRYSIRLPDTFITQCWNDSVLAGAKQDVKDRFVQLFGPMTDQPPDTVIGDKVFEYWVRRDNKENSTTAWVLRFYASVYFCCITSTST